MGGRASLASLLAVLLIVTLVPVGQKESTSLSVSSEEPIRVSTNVEAIGWLITSPSSTGVELPIIKPVQRGRRAGVSATATIPKPIPTPIKLPVKSTKGFIWDGNVSFYGPHFYGHRTACGLILTTRLLGVAHKTLPCGTKVTFLYKGVQITVPVVDRGPYVAGRQWDLTGWAAVKLHHVFTGAIYFRVER